MLSKVISVILSPFRTKDEIIAQSKIGSIFEFIILKFTSALVDYILLYYILYTPPALLQRQKALSVCPALPG